MSRTSLEVGSLDLPESGILRLLLRLLEKWRGNGLEADRYMKLN